MIAVDTSALIAAVDTQDQWHAAASTVFAAPREAFVVPAGILAEVASFFERWFGIHVLGALLAQLETGAYLLDCGDVDIPRIRQLVTRYADLPLGFADAAVIACAERRGGRVLTFDRHFTIVAREGTIEVVPPLGA